MLCIMLQDLAAMKPNLGGPSCERQGKVMRCQTASGVEVEAASPEECGDIGIRTFQRHWHPKLSTAIVFSPDGSS